MNPPHKWPFETPICKLSVFQCSYLQSHSLDAKKKRYVELSIDLFLQTNWEVFGGKKIHV